MRIKLHHREQIKKKIQSLAINQPIVKKLNWKIKFYIKKKQYEIIRLNLKHAIRIMRSR